jgi:hypothetical protein
MRLLEITLPTLPILLSGSAIDCIERRQIPDRTRTGRGGTFDTAIREFAPTIAKAQLAGCWTIHELAEVLNQSES